MKTTDKEEQRRTEALKTNRVICKKCGHIMYATGDNKCLCQWCGIYAFKTEKAEFTYRLKERLLRK